MLAQLVGIGRGADLLFYIAIIIGLLYIVNEYKRSVRLARLNTRLAREITLTEARLNDRISELEARLDAPRTDSGSSSPSSNTVE